jgi:hypothetical protein
VLRPQFLPLVCHGCAVDQNPLAQAASDDDEGSDRSKGKGASQKKDRVAAKVFAVYLRLDS